MFQYSEKILKMPAKELEENKVFFDLSQEAINASKLINLKYDTNGFGIHCRQIRVYSKAINSKHVIVADLDINGTLTIKNIMNNLESTWVISILDAENIFQIFKYDYLHSVHRDNQIPPEFQSKNISYVAYFLRSWVQQLYEEYGVIGG